MNDWAEIMGRRDRLAVLLRPHLGKAPARERANDIVQALLSAQEQADEVALRLLARDLEPRAAAVVAFQVGKAWMAPQEPIFQPGSDVSTTETSTRNSAAQGSKPAVRPRAAGPLPLVRAVQAAVRFRRPRRETVLMSELPDAVRRLSNLWT